MEKTSAPGFMSVQAAIEVKIYVLKMATLYISDGQKSITVQINQD